MMWITRRKVSFGVHLLFIVLPLGLATAAAFRWWSEALGDPWMAAALIATLEILGITSLVLHIARIQWPLPWLRHIIPLFSTIPLVYELYTYLHPNVGQGAATTFACVIGIWFSWLAFILLHSLEALFISPLEAAQENVQARMESLALVLGEWKTASEAVHSFAMSVVPPPQPTPQRDMPLLLAPPSAHPKMGKIAGLAGLRAEDGSWMLSAEDIQRETRCDLTLVVTLTKLVRAGQLVLQEVDNE